MVITYDVSNSYQSRKSEMNKYPMHIKDQIQYTFMINKILSL